MSLYDARSTLAHSRLATGALVLLAVHDNVTDDVWTTVTHAAAHVVVLGALGRIYRRLSSSSGRSWPSTRISSVCR